MRLLSECYGVARSLFLYYGDPFQARRMVRFYARLIRPGDLCFDIGAHAGSRIAAWSRLGAQVVAVEPQPTFASLLRRLYAGRPNVRLVQAALGERPGQQSMLVSDQAPTVSTLSDRWAARVQRSRRSFAEVRWNRSIVVPVTTLDALIAHYGEPAFCKIDVEGYECEVLSGLSRPLRMLSFEYIPPALDLAASCLERLGALGHYEFNWASGEPERLELSTWVGPGALLQILKSLPADSAPGDVYARLQSA